MPADRRITINVSAEGTRNEQHGEYVPGAITPIRSVGQPTRPVPYRHCDRGRD